MEKIYGSKHMLVSTCLGGPVLHETQASIPERPGRVTSSRAGGARILQRSLAMHDELCVKAIPLLKQILKVFICGLAQRNGHILKLMWAK